MLSANLDLKLDFNGGINNMIYIYSYSTVINVILSNHHMVSYEIKNQLRGLIIAFIIFEAKF